MATDAYNEGRAAYSDDKELIDNPHPAGASSHLEWQKGWRDAKSSDPLAEMCSGGDDDDCDDEDS